jgi:hypothetical protein
MPRSIAVLILALVNIIYSSSLKEAKKESFEFTGGSECLVQSKEFPKEFLYPVNQLTLGSSIYKTVCLKGLNELDLFNKVVWRIVRADQETGTFYLKTTSRVLEEYLCSVTSFFDFWSGYHELKRMTKLKKGNCEWKIEPIASNKTVLYTITNQVHQEPIFASSLNFNSKLIRRNVYLKHAIEPSDLSDNFKWIIDC